VALSPYTQETEPSFFVNYVDGHWLFKDFSSGYGGSIIDFVQIKEKVSRVNDAIQYIRKLLSSEEIANFESRKSPLKHNSYNLEKIYEKIKANDIDVSREYLKSRGISEYLIQELDSQKLLLHNRSKMRSYCCFVVKDESGEVRCLDNHEIGGDKKFVLGEKRIFSLDWSILRISEKIFITEGIIDYLSIKVLEGRKIPGFALMGNVPIFEPELLPKVKTIISALDLDSSGLSGNLDLRNLFPMTEIVRYDMEEHKDPNELLKAIKAQKRTNLSPETKLKLFQEFLVSENKSELAKKWGVDRSYMYEIVRECEESITAGFKEKKPGRRPNGKPVTLD
jgi:DNA primase